VRHLQPAFRLGYARLHLRELRDVDYRTKTFSCSIYGSDGAMALDEPCKDTGVKDYRLDQRIDPKHHPAAVKRLTDPRRRPPIRYAGDELPSRKVDGRR
jgi:hypothetical protein